jgi:hypothetical protein
MKNMLSYIIRTILNVTINTWHSPNPLQSNKEIDMRVPISCMKVLVWQTCTTTKIQDPNTPKVNIFIDAINFLKKHKIQGLSSLKNNSISNQTIPSFNFKP